MPHWDIHCEQCGITSDREFKNHAAMREHVDAGCQWCDGPLEVIISAPTFRVNGFNALNHYGARHTDVSYKDPKTGYNIKVKHHTEEIKGQG